MNFDLMKAGYTPAIIRKEDRLAYYDVLDEASVSGVYDPVTQLVAESVRQSLKVYLDLLGSRPNDDASDKSTTPGFRM
jgi:hypothetical protein